MAREGLPPLNAVRAEAARRSLACFFRYSWPVLEQATPLVWNWHLQSVCDHVQALLEGRIAKRNLAINIPPGSAKSRIVSVCVTAWWWIDHPWWKGIFASGNPRTVVRDSLNCRNLIDSAWYQNSFHPQWAFSADQNAKMLYRNTAGGFRMAVTSNAKVTGDRGDGLFMDDLLDADFADRKVERENVIHWYDHAFANRLNDMTTGIRCMIAQRLHEGDPVGHVVASGEWDQLVIRQEFEAKDAERVSPIGWKDPRTTEGELMDPVRFPPDVLKSERTRLGSGGYAAQHQQRPAPAEGAIIKRHWLNYMTFPDVEDPLELLRILGINFVVQAWDTALTEKTTGDYTAGFTLGVTDTRLIALDLFKKKVESPDAKRALKTSYAKWKPHAVAIEGGSSHSGKAIAQELRRETRIPLIEVPHTTDKVTRVSLVAPTIESGRFWLPDNRPWVADFVESLVVFPKGVNDDDVDAWEMAVSYAERGGGGRGILEYYRKLSDKQKAEKAAADKARVA